MRFVEAFLAYESGAASEVFLLEEFIDPREEGPFIKYINNNSAIPLELASVIVT